MDREGTKVAPSPFDVMMNSMNQDQATTGMSCQVKRRLPDGTMVDADPKALGSLSTKSRMAYAAQNLKKMTASERTAWALEMKEYANALYAEQMITEAMEKYVEALAASNFGAITPKKVVTAAKASGDAQGGEDPAGNADLDLTHTSRHSDNNVDDLIVPVLCNLAACCIQTKQFAKALKFADAALELRPRCGKALMRRGMALVHAGETRKAIHALQVALEVVDGVIELGAGTEGVDVDDLRLQPCMAVSETDRLRIPVLIERAQKAQEKHEKLKSNQLKQMQKVFGADSCCSSSSGSGSGSGNGCVSAIAKANDDANAKPSVALAEPGAVQPAAAASHWVTILAVCIAIIYTFL